jgi:23S rRNA pseudouridine1911/1915/1917 synthase
MVKYRVAAAYKGTRADIFITHHYPEFSRSALEKLFDKDMISIESTPIKAGYKLKGTEILVVDESKLRAKPEAINLPVIYEDEDVIVINKPEGILTHSKGALVDEATVATFIQPKLNDISLTGNRAGIVHRLDRGTSGVIICAKNAASQSKLQKQFSQRKTRKLYTAIVDGIPDAPEAIIDAPIEITPKRPQTFKVSSSGKPATTHYKVISSYEKGEKTYSLVELKPTTGRTHQIRVHMAYIGHPITGDRTYGNPGKHLYLHAKSLEITLPSSERRVFCVEPPNYFKDLMNE